MRTIIKTDRNNRTAALPFGSFVDQVFRGGLNRFFEEDPEGGSRFSDRPFQAPVNIRETEKHYELELVAPGLSKEDFSIQVANDILTVGFEDRQEKTEENDGQGWIRKEYRKRSFSRSFSLDENVEVAGIEASYKDGILHLTLPRKEATPDARRKIEVN